MMTPFTEDRRLSRAFVTNSSIDLDLINRIRVAVHMNLTSFVTSVTRGGKR